MRMWTIIFVSVAATVAALGQDDAGGLALLLARAAFVLLVVVSLLHGARILTLQMADACEAPTAPGRSRDGQRGTLACAPAQRRLPSPATPAATASAPNRRRR